jgi:hypothetical protein
MDELQRGVYVYLYRWTAHVGMVWLNTWLAASQATLVLFMYAFTFSQRTYGPVY